MEYLKHFSRVFRPWSGNYSGLIRQFEFYFSGQAIFTLRELHSRSVIKHHAKYGQSVINAVVILKHRDATFFYLEDSVAIAESKRVTTALFAETLFNISHNVDALPCKPLWSMYDPL